MIKIGCLSDIHGFIYGLVDKVFNGVELLIIAGDICPTDEIKIQEEWLEFNFKNVFKSKKIFPDLQEIIIVPGNHDYWIERNYKDFPEKLRRVLGYDVKILVDEEYEYISLLTGESIKIYGNPRCSLWLHAFPHKPGNEDISSIPCDIDILVTHEAPRLFELDCVKQSQGWYGDNDIPGNLALGQRVLEVNPKYHIFGHIHYPCKKVIGNTIFINVSQQIREKYNPELYIIEYTG